MILFELKPILKVTFKDLLINSIYWIK